MLFIVWLLVFNMQPLLRKETAGWIDLSFTAPKATYLIQGYQIMVCGMIYAENSEFIVSLFITTALSIEKMI